MKKKISRVPRVIYNEFKNSLEHDPCTHQIKLMRYEGLI